VHRGHIADEAVEADAHLVQRRYDRGSHRLVAAAEAVAPTVVAQRRPIARRDVDREGASEAVDAIGTETRGVQGAQRFRLRLCSEAPIRRRSSTVSMRSSAATKRRGSRNCVTWRCRITGRPASSGRDSTSSVRSQSNSQRDSSNQKSSEK
jgi:hypothetical protein